MKIVVGGLFGLVAYILLRNYRIAVGPLSSALQVFSAVSASWTRGSGHDTNRPSHQVALGCRDGNGGPSQIEVGKIESNFAVSTSRTSIRLSPSNLRSVAAQSRRQTQWTANKYALWDAGYRNKLGRGPIPCACGVMFNPSLYEETMAHIAHITGRPPGT